VIPKAEALSTSARWASVGTYSAGILRFQSLNQGTRARYTKNAGKPLGCGYRGNRTTGIWKMNLFRTYAVFVVLLTLCPRGFADPAPIVHYAPAENLEAY
jgi:hypothetical protein